VSDGTRTRDFLDHNQVLYQLSYTHHGRTDPRRVKCTGPADGEGNAHSGSGGGSGTAPVSLPWWRRATVRAVPLSGPGGGTNTASR
jgi:hypothetical protein